MSTLDALKAEKRNIITKYSKRNDFTAFMQTLTTIVPYFALFYVAIESANRGVYWLTAVSSAVLILIVLRVFMMMHDAGHKCLYQDTKPNVLVGFIMGVLCGIPEHVWSKHHAYHHSTNGNWNKYRGPLNVLASDEYAALNDKKKKSYVNSRNILLAPLGGFMYFIFNPRFTWAKGSLQFLAHCLTQKVKAPTKPLKEIAAEFKTGFWADKKEYFHMAANNVVLLSAWVLASLYFGAAAFFAVYVFVLSIAGALGIILFTIQHNFEDSYASDDEGWDYNTAAILGTSYLDLPKILHWFTADIGYHHVHHLSARIPNYKLVECHEEFAHLFGDVKRIKLSQSLQAFKHILWDKESRQMITIEKFNALYPDGKVTPVQKDMTVNDEALQEA